MKGLTIKLHTPPDGNEAIYKIKAGDMLLQMCSTLEEAVKFVDVVDAAYSVESVENE